MKIECEKKGPDNVCAGAAGKVKLTVEALPEHRSYVLIEGDRKAFEFLHDLSALMLRTETGGFQIAPNGPGNALFKKGSEYGLYLHRLPCIEKTLQIKIRDLAGLGLCLLPSSFIESLVC